MANKIVMLGAFSQGMAEDQKPTPFGLMFGVEIHANALNTILMGNFLRYAPFWLSILILFGVVMLTAFMTGRLSTVWSLVVLVVVVALYFGAVLVLFDFYAYILSLSAPLFGAFLSFLGVVAYRTIFEEKDKRRNKAIFSKIVGPAILDQILEHPPELLPGAKEALRAVSEKGYRVGLISNTGKTPGSTLRVLMGRMGILDIFHVTTFSNEIMVRKPAEAAFRVTLEQLKVLPKAAAHVGDDPEKDIAGAKRVGMHAVQVMAHAKSPAEEADARTDSMDGVPEALERLG